MKNKVALAGWVLLGLLALPSLAAAQSLLLQGPPADRGRFTLRYFWPQKGSYDRRGPEIFSGLYDLSADFRVSERINVIAAVPYMINKVSYRSYNWEIVSESMHGLGNASIALEFLLGKKSARSTSLTLGAFLPTLTSRSSHDWRENDDYAYLAQIGWLADYAEFPKVLDAMTPFARVAHYRELKGGWRVGMEGGAFILLPRGGDYSPIFVHYGAAAGRGIGPLELKAEVRGSAQVAGFVDEVYIRLFHQAAVAIAWGRGRLRPGIFYTISLDQYFHEDSVGAIGFRLQYEL